MLVLFHAYAVMIVHHSSTSNLFTTQYFLLISPSPLHVSIIHHLSPIHFHTYSFLSLLFTTQIDKRLTLSAEHLPMRSCEPHFVTPLATQPNVSPSSYHKQFTNTLHCFHHLFSLTSYILPLPHQQLTTTFINSIHCNLILHNITSNHTYLISISSPSLQVCCNTHNQ